MTAQRLEEALRRARRDALAPPPLLSLSEWAALYARLSVGANAMPGRFEAFAYQRGWLDAITDPNVRQVTVQKSARVGYTRCLDHAVGYFIHQDPSPVLFVMPRIEDCEDFSRSEILPMLTDTPVLAELVGDIKTRDANQHPQAAVSQRRIGGLRRRQLTGRLPPHLRACGPIRRSGWFPARSRFRR
jgi:phage terminase large subunit GpA-like protein